MPSGPGRELHASKASSSRGCARLSSRLPMTRMRRVAVIESDGRIGIEDAQLSFEARLFKRFAEVLDGLDAVADRECQRCNGIFLAKRCDTVYCSNRCRQGHWRQENPVRVAEIQSRYDQKCERPRLASKTRGGSRITPRVQANQGRQRRAPRLPGSARAGEFRKIVMRIVT